MIGKKFFEFCSRPLQLFGSLNLLHHRPTFQSTNAFSNRSEEGAILEQKRNREEDDRDNSNSEWKFSLKAAILPVLYFVNKKSKRSKCDSAPLDEKIEKNKLNNRFASIQYPANNPIEDRYHTQQLNSIDGYVAAVFDGHGGWQVAELAQAHLANILDEILKEKKDKYTDTDQYIIDSIKAAFDRVVSSLRQPGETIIVKKEEEYLDIARKAYAVGFAKVARVGACALVTVVHDNKLYVANAGDCKGVLISVNESGEASHKKITQTFNANSKKEQARLKQTFQDADIFTCKESGACYVKGRLMPTRAFGDFTLKYEEFNNPKNLDSSLGYSRKLQNYNGPYITHSPDIKVIELTAHDRYVILSSDGMWDELKKPDVTQIVKEIPEDKEKLTQELLRKALAVVSEKSKLSDTELANTPLGARRKIHDDMTILIVDIRNQC